MGNNLIIIGAGSVGGHIALNPKLYGINKKIVGFLDDDISKYGKKIFGLKVLGSRNWILDKEGYSVVIGIAFPKIKREIIRYLRKNESLKFPTLIAKNSWISNNCSIGKGCVIYPGCSVNYGSEIKDFVVINMNCALGHNSYVGDFSSLAPNVSFGGHTKIGEAVEIGIGSSTIQNVKVGDESVIGGQTILIKDVPRCKTIVGNPGRSIHK